MHQRRKQRRKEKQAAAEELLTEVVDSEGINPETPPIFAAPTTNMPFLPVISRRRTMIHTLLDETAPDDRPEPPDMSVIKKAAPEIAKALAVIAWTLDGQSADIEFLRREAPTYRCNLTENVGIHMTAAAEEIKKKKEEVIEISVWGKTLRVRVAVIMVIAATLGRIWWPELGLLFTALGL